MYDVLIIAGSTDVKKSAIIKTLCHHFPGQYQLAYTVTTRPAREDEGENLYLHIPRHAFIKLLTTNSIIEVSNFAGEWYGTLLEVPEGHDSPPLSNLSEPSVNSVPAKETWVFDITHGSYDAVKSKHPNAKGIGILPTAEQLHKQLSRQEASTEQLLDRLEEELKNADKYSDYDLILLNEEDRVTDMVSAINQFVAKPESTLNRKRQILGRSSMTT